MTIAFCDCHCDFKCGILHLIDVNFWVLYDVLNACSDLSKSVFGSDCPNKEVIKST